MIRTRHLFVALGLAIAAAPGCVVRGSGSASMSMGTTAVVYQEPPAPQVETVNERPGHIWVRGRWNWQNGQWAWIGGHWERQRSGYAWTEGRWERRGNSWHWIEGSWVVSSSAPVVTGPAPDVSNASGGVVVSGGGPHTHHHGGGGTVVVSGGGAPPVDVSNASGGVVVSSGGGMYPTAAPPPARVESQGPRAGYIFVRGRWEWKNGRWDWVAGHWERARSNQVWVDGRWELQGNYYVWVDGRWDTQAAPAPAGQVRDHRR
ncbi:MAG TPA: hypothetical protein VM513_00910 [Kofleriaceae bacterium]|jgi:hypothetical protein|nr:hypothetical protein [Kofleriaceae bacterium]